MQIVEIRIGGGLLLLSRQAAFPAYLLRSSDQLELVSILKTMSGDRRAAGQLRREARSLGMRLPANSASDRELIDLLHRMLRAGQLKAAFLRDGALRGGDGIEEPLGSHVLHVPLPGMTMLIAGKGMLPPEFAGHSDPARAAKVLRAMAHGGEGAKAVDRQAHRLPGGSVKKSSGLPLRSHIVFQLQAGGFDAAILSAPTTLAKAAARADAPKPVRDWSTLEKVREALRLCVKHLPQELATAAAFTIILEIGAFLASVIPVQFIPVGGEVVDVALAAAAYAVAGLSGLYAIWQLVHATYTAARATSEAELEEAGQEYAAGFVAIGIAKLAELRAKLFERRIGGQAQIDRGKTTSVISSSSPNTTNNEPKHDQSGNETGSASNNPSKEATASANTGNKSKKGGSTTVQVDDTNQTVTIRTKMEFSGPDATKEYAEAAKKQIEETWGGTMIRNGKTYKVKIEIETNVNSSGKPTPGFDQIIVDAKNKRMNQTLHGAGPGNQTPEAATDKARPRRIAHEYGHTLGLPDGYHDTPTGSAKNDPDKANDIMSETWPSKDGTLPHPHQDHYEQVLKNYGW